MALTDGEKDEVREDVVVAADGVAVRSLTMVAKPRLKTRDDVEQQSARFKS